MPALEDFESLQYRPLRVLGSNETSIAKILAVSYNPIISIRPPIVSIALFRDKAGFGNVTHISKPSGREGPANQGYRSNLTVRRSTSDQSPTVQGRRVVANDLNMRREYLVRLILSVFLSLYIEEDMNTIKFLELLI